MSRLAKLQQLLEKNPADVFLHFGLAMELAKEGAIDDAVARFDRVLSLDPKYIPAHFQKGNALLAAGRSDDARAALRTGIAAAMTHGDPHAAEEMQGVIDSIA